ncbi:NAD-P-binding protein [Roridomyces roridus]|uniref:NAD-P-binding protein n=1 Tax=Roridomyces roridus TaxID=1738132 RepID=A0AAD7FZL1_9AGAR|nr:NAD-P-binding protein [Roridomyces roridus]
MSSTSPRVWLITGANSGLGLALAECVLSQGDHVIAAVRKVSSIPESIKDAKPLVLNLNASDSEIKQAGSEALKIYGGGRHFFRPPPYGRVDVLVNNAGYCLTGYTEELDDADIKREFQTNFFGAISLTQSLLPAFRQQKSGHILNLSSVAAMAGGAPFAMYNASKAALEAATESLSLELAPFNIRVLIIEPGYFPTNFLATAGANGTHPTRSTGAYPDWSTVPDGYAARHVASKQVGDLNKAAARMFEVVSGTGLAEEFVASGRREFVRPDCGTRLRAKVKLLAENVEATEKIWSSTDMDEDKFTKFAQQ